MSTLDAAGAETTAELVASRARILADADEGRRRLQREIHDGAQQRLVHALIVLKLARSTIEAASPAAALVQEALTNVEQANRDLRAVVNAILPRSLTYGGLRTGLQSLADDLAVPVRLRVSAPRLGPEIETTVFLAVAEALADVVGSGAQRIDLDVTLADETLVVEVRDDRTGAAAPGPTPGLTAVLDRVHAVEGRVTTADPPEGGRALRIEVPVLVEAGAVEAGGPPE